VTTSEVSSVGDRAEFVAKSVHDGLATMVEDASVLMMRTGPSM
jgi:hypothetical protein